MNTYDPGYHSLREQIEALLTETRLHSRQVAEWQKVEMHWLIYDALVAHIDAHPGPTYGQYIVRNFSNNLKLGATALCDILRLRRVVSEPNLYARTNLGWSHFRALVHLGTQEQFDRYARLAADNQWTTRQLKRAIEAGGDTSPAVSDDPSPLRARFGDPWTYRVLADRPARRWSPRHRLRLPPGLGPG